MSLCVAGDASCHLCCWRSTGCGTSSGTGRFWLPTNLAPLIAGASSDMWPLLGAATAGLLADGSLLPAIRSAARGLNLHLQ